MTSFPNSPRLIKGVLVGVDLFNPLASVVVFQYNPDTMTRRHAQLVARDGNMMGMPLKEKEDTSKPFTEGEMVRHNDASMGRAVLGHSWATKSFTLTVGMTRRCPVTRKSKGSRVVS